MWDNVRVDICNCFSWLLVLNWIPVVRNVLIFQGLGSIYMRVSEIYSCKTSEEQNLHLNCSMAFSEGISSNLCKL